jgi:hypothetical protein
MSKFIQFNVQLSGTAQPLEPIAPVLINVEDIARYTAVGAGPIANAKTLAINLCGRYERTAVAATLPGRVLTLTFATSTVLGTNPITVDGQPNPFVQALVAAMSQDVPGVAVYQLGNDQSTAAAAPNGNQMYIASAVFS